MKKLIMIALAASAAAMLTGCSTPAKMRDVELKGMYVNGYSETLAIGAGRLTSIPGEREAMAAHYREDTAWLQPSIKTHELDLFLVGSNTVANADKIIEHICKAFADVAPDMVKTNAEIAKAGGTTPLDVVKAGGEVRKTVQLAKTAVESAKVAAATAEAKAAAAQTATQAAPDAQTATTAADCANGACAVGASTDGACTGGNCTENK